MMRRFCRQLLPLIALGIGACTSSEDGNTHVTSTQVSERTSAIVTHAAKTSIQSAQGAAKLESLGTLADSVGDLFGLFGSSGEVAADDPGMMPKIARAVASASTAEEDGAWSFVDEDQMDAQEQSDELGKILAECIFVDANLEASDSHSATFLLHGDLMCNCNVESGYELTGQALADCQADWDDLEVRVRTTLVDTQGVNVDLMFGPDRFNPTTLLLRPNSIAVDVHLGALVDTAHFIDDLNSDDSTSGATADEGLPADLTVTGTVRASLTVNGEEDITVALSVVQAIAVEFSEDEGLVSIGVGISEPLLSLRAVGGTAPSATFAIGLGEVDLSLPWALVVSNDDPTAPAPDPAPTGTMSLHIAGLDASVTATEDMGPSVTLNGLGLGDAASWLKKDAGDLVRIDLNADSGRHFDLTITPDDGDSLNPEDDTATFAFSPGLDVVAYFGFGAVKADLEANQGPEDEGVPSFLLDETISVALEGISGAALYPVPETDTFAGGIEVSSGTLTLSSQPTGGQAASITVDAGQCLVAQDALPDSHPLIGSLASGACE